MWLFLLFFFSLKHVLELNESGVGVRSRSCWLFHNLTSWPGVGQSRFCRNTFVDFDPTANFKMGHFQGTLDYVPPEEPPSKPLGNALRIR